VGVDVRRLSNKKNATAKKPEPSPVDSPMSLHGELFICLDDAVKQAREFRTTWQSELTRYVIHGLLHLCGHDHETDDGRMLSLQRRVLEEL
jgi:probable rRNA maturation factor